MNSASSSVSTSTRGTVRSFTPESDDLDPREFSQAKRVKLDFQASSQLGVGVAGPSALTSNSAGQHCSHPAQDAYKAETNGGAHLEPTTSSNSVASCVMSSQRTYTRDEKYYFEDGSCVLLVEDTLFNVHRSMLSRDHSFFSTMFTLPQSDQTELEGGSDSNPIVLSGDSSEEFRYFLWALYALPPELAVVHTPSADLALLIGIARVSNKYAFRTLVDWSLGAIHEYVNRKPSILGVASTYTFSISAAMSTTTSGAVNASQLTALIRLAQLCSHLPLLNSMISLLRGLMSSSLQYAYLAMTLADELDLSVLRGAAYCELLNNHKEVIVRRIPAKSGKRRADGEVPESDADHLSEGDIDESGRLLVTPAQQMRLLTGYYRLSRIFEDIRSHPPTFEHSATCAATWQLNGCTQSWGDFWKEKIKSDAVLNLGNADVLGKLRCIMRDFERWGSATYMHQSCRTLAAASIKKKILEIEDQLGDFFVEG